MKLSLARFEEGKWGSRGLWLIRELPGFYVSRYMGKWDIGCAGHIDSEIWRENTQKAWGKTWQPMKKLYTSLPERLQGDTLATKPPFGTRREALTALETELSKREREAGDQSEDEPSSLASTLL